MAISVPEWLAKRGGGLRQGSDPHVWLVTFRGEPQYRLTAVPVSGQFGCVVTQTINGKRIPCTATAATEEEAIRAGLEALRQALGW
ncbi:MAG: hypothetical protein L0Z62_32185 [Gemmataceae bacterium]|nr:hypothetical protein [Gemmataceae bacterium]